MRPSSPQRRATAAALLLVLAATPLLFAAPAAQAECSSDDPSCGTYCVVHASACFQVGFCSPPSTVGVTLSGKVNGGRCVAQPVPPGVPSVVSCGVYYTPLTPAPTAGQVGVVLDFPPYRTTAAPGTSPEDTAFCYGAYNGPPGCPAGQVAVIENNVPGPCGGAPTLCPGTTTPGPGWKPGVNPTCESAPWVDVGLGRGPPPVPAGTPPCPAGTTVHVIIYWGTTPGSPFPPNAATPLLCF